MTHITCTFSSVCMETDVTFHLLLPSSHNGLQPSPNPVIPENGFPTLYLLHGIGDSAESWFLYSPIGMLCEQYKIAIVLPSFQNTFYLDDPEGKKAFSYLTSELLEYTRAVFPLSRKREETFICGYSMGGYGAVRAGLLCPHIFGKIISLSGALDICQGASYARICGYSLPTHLKSPKALHQTNADLFFCLSQANTDQNIFPHFYIACGTEDIFVECTRNFHKQAAKKDLHVFIHLSKGGHDWHYWSHSLCQGIEWLFCPSADYSA